MNRRRLLAGVFLALWAPALLAFIPGPTIVRQCPYCSALFTGGSTLSGNDFDAVIWTDGAMDAPMDPEWPRLVKCWKCKRLIWVEEAKEVGEFGGIVIETKRSKKDRRWAKAKNPDEPMESDLLALAEKLHGERERYVRIWIWQMRNNEVRGRSGGNDGWTETRKKNIQRLREILDEKVPVDRFLLAEIARELGDFDSCLRLLEGGLRGVNPDLVVTTRKLAKAKSTAIIAVPREEDHSPAAATPGR